MPNIFNINDKNILATASITITDQTDAATLAGGISVVSGSKNQVYLTGSASPFSPDWSKNKLVLRPYLIATTIIRGTGTMEEYNPDLFDPEEYPDLDRPNDINVSTPYINRNDLSWYVRDANGTEKLINPTTDPNFTFMYTHNGTIYNDKRYLVIQNNFIPKDSFVTIICKFSFYDPFAKIFIPCSYELDLSCLSTGQGTNQLVIHSVNGTSIYNSHPTYIDLYTSFYRDGVETDIQQEIEATEKNSKQYWYIRSSSGNGWTLLDGAKQNNADYEFKDLFEVRRYTGYDSSFNVYATEETTSSRGGFYLRVHPGLIDGSSVIKAVFTNSDDNRNYSALEVVHDTTDDIQAYIHSSNGDKIYQGIKDQGTVLTCMIKYQGELLNSDDSRYETNFEYYWFKMSSDGTQTWNVYLDSNGTLLYQELSEENKSIPLKSSSRILPIKAADVDNVNMFQCAIIDKVNAAMVEQRAAYILNSPSEDDLIAAAMVNSDLGIDENDNDALLNTAYEINATNIANGTSLKD